MFVLLDFFATRTIFGRSHPGWDVFTVVSQDSQGRSYAVALFACLPACLCLSSGGTFGHFWCSFMACYAVTQHLSLPVPERAGQRAVRVNCVLLEILGMDEQGA